MQKLPFPATVREISQWLEQHLSHVVPPLERLIKAELIAEIQALKKEKSAVILGHNYMEPALFHSVPDFVGDSLALSEQASKTKASLIVFCGVRFMAETAKILSPDKKVLLPSLKAGCSLADSITAQELKILRASFPDVPAVAYVNCSAEVKAEVDICCTSSNVYQIMTHLDSEGVIFVPDQYMGANVARETGRQFILPQKISDQQYGLSTQPNGPYIIGWPGSCEVHELFTVEDITTARLTDPDVVVLAHPECRPEVVEAADVAGSTSEMIRYVREHAASRYLLLTECAMGDNIVAELPDRQLMRLCSHRCPHMAQITLEQTRDALLKEQYEIHVDDHLIERARHSLNRMLEFKTVQG